MFQFSDVLIFQKSPRLPLSTASCLPPVTKVCRRENLATNPAGMGQNLGHLEWNQRHRIVPGWKMSTIHTEVRVRPDFLLLHLTICSNIYRNRTRLAPKWQICDLKWYSNVIGFFFSVILKSIDLDTSVFLMAFLFLVGFTLNCGKYSWR